MQYFARPRAVSAQAVIEIDIEEGEPEDAYITC